MERYMIILEPLGEEDGGGFFATFPDLPGCQADGETIEDAIAHARDAFDAWMRTQRERGVDIPAPGEAQDRARHAVETMQDTIADQVAEIARLRTEIAALKKRRSGGARWAAIKNHTRTPPINPLLAG